MTRFRSLLAISFALFAAIGLSSCTTTYDAYGRPTQSVDPGLAIAGVAAAGILGYALADDNDNHHHYHNRRTNWGGHGGWGGGYYNQGGYCPPAW